MDFAASIWLERLPVGIRARPRLALGAAALAVASVLLLAAWLWPDRGEASLQTARVERGDVRITLVESGELRAESQATVSASTDKQIVWLVPEGTHVKQGDPVVRFETTKYEIEKATAESALAVVRADLEKALGALQAQQATEEKARLEYAALPELAEKGYVNRNELDAARLAHEEVKASTRSFQAAVVAARANVEKAERDVQQADRKLKEGDVRAPRDGVVVYATTGEAASPRKITVGMVPFEGMNLLYLPDPSSMRVDAEITEFDLAKVRVGTPVELHLDAYPEAVFHGEVDTLSSLARQKLSRATGQPLGVKVFDVGIKVLDRDERLKPGLSTTVEILVSENPNVLHVPIAAIFVDDLDRTVVYVDEGGKIVERRVELAGSTDRIAIVASGVEEGDEVLLSPPPSARGAS